MSKTDTDTRLAEGQKPVRIDRESVKTLAIAVGVREAARQIGLPESTVKSWSTRYQWFKQPELPPTMQVASNASTSPSVALLNTLAERKQKTKLHLSKYITDAAENAACSEGSLKIAQDVRHVAAVAANVWPEEQQENRQTLNILSIQGDMIVNRE